MATVATFDIEYTQFLDPQGEPTQALPAFALDPEALFPLYRAMVLTRQFDLKAIALQRTGQIGTFASALGQEAVGVGVASAMRAQDVLVPSYRDHAAQFQRGVSMTESLLYWGGDERGNAFAAAPHDFANCVPIGNQVCHAAGIAYAMKLRREPRAAVCLLGDGGTSKGDFYEGMNMAGAWHAPLVLVVNNNQWAISVPVSAQMICETIAVRAEAYGMPGVRVDGNDVLAVYVATKAAVERARNAEEVSALGRELYERIWRLAGHLDDLAKGLTRTVEAYNRTVGTIESRVLVTARRFKELGVSAAEPIPEVPTVERTPRPLQAPEMADLFGAPDEPDDEDDRDRD